VNGGLTAIVDGDRVVPLEARPPVAAKILTTPDGPETQKIFWLFDRA